MFFSQHLSFPLSVPFHHCSTPIHPPTTHAVQCSSASTTVFPCQYHSTIAPYPFILSLLPIVHTSVSWWAPKSSALSDLRDAMLFVKRHTNIPPMCVLQVSWWCGTMALSSWHPWTRSGAHCLPITPVWWQSWRLVCCLPCWCHVWGSCSAAAGVAAAVGPDHSPSRSEGTPAGELALESCWLPSLSSSCKISTKFSISWSTVLLQSELGRICAQL